jgi:hypothetical protein
MMMQDQQSGSEARDFGIRAAAHIAKKLNARPVSSSANVFRIGDQVVAIKTSRGKRKSVYLAKSVLRDVKLLFVGLERSRQHFEVYRIEISALIGSLDPARNNHKGRGYYLSGTKCRQLGVRAFDTKIKHRRYDP